jgi:hypothetical protein
MQSYSIDQALQKLHSLWLTVLKECRKRPENVVIGLLLFASFALLYKKIIEPGWKVKPSVAAQNGTTSNAHDDVDVDSVRSASGYTNDGDDEEENDEGSYSEGSRADSDTLSAVSGVSGVSGVSSRSGKSTASRRSSRSAAARKSSFRKLSK